MSTLAINSGDDVRAKIARDFRDGGAIDFRDAVDRTAADNALSITGRSKVVLTGNLKRTHRWLAIYLNNVSQIECRDLSLDGGGIRAERFANWTYSGGVIRHTRGSNDRDNSCITYEHPGKMLFEKLTLRDGQRETGGQNGIFGYGAVGAVFRDIEFENLHEGIHVMDSRDMLLERLRFRYVGRCSIEIQGGRGGSWGTIRQVLVEKPHYLGRERWFPISLAAGENDGLLVEDLTVLCDIDFDPTGVHKNLPRDDSGKLHGPGWAVEQLTRNAILRRLYLVGGNDTGIAVCNTTTLEDCRVYVAGPDVSIMGVYRKWGYDPRIVRESGTVTGDPTPERFAAAPRFGWGGDTPQPAPRPVLGYKVVGVDLVLTTPDGSSQRITGRTTRVTEVVGEGSTVRVKNLVPGWAYWFKAPGYDEIEVRMPGAPPAGYNKWDEFYLQLDTPQPEPEPVDEHAACKKQIAALESDKAQATERADDYAERLAKIVALASV